MTQAFPLDHLLSASLGARENEPETRVVIEATKAMASLSPYQETVKKELQHRTAVRELSAERLEDKRGAAGPAQFCFRQGLANYSGLHITLDPQLLPKIRLLLKEYRDL